MLSTQGRSFWILDDLTPLRELALDLRATTAGTVGATGTPRLYTPRPAARGYVGEPLREVDHVRPDDLPHGALVHYVLPAGVRALEIDIVRDGTPVRSFRSDSAEAARFGTARLRTNAGFHRLAWDLRGFGPRAFSADGAPPLFRGQGVKLPPGAYTVILRAGTRTLTRPLTVTGNPRAPEIKQADYDAQFVASVAARDTITALNRMVGALTETRRRAIIQLDSARAALAAPRPAAPARARALEIAAAALADRAEELLAVLVPRREEGQLAAPAGLLSQYNTLYNAFVGDGGYGAGSAEGRPSAGRLQRQADLDRAWRELRERYERMQAEEVARYRAAGGRAPVR